MFQMSSIGGSNDYVYDALKPEEDDVEAEDRRATSRIPTPQIVRRRLISFLFAALPSYIQCLLPAGKSRPWAKRKLRKTSYLDGVRGWASLFVVTYHHVSPYKNYGATPFTLGKHKGSIPDSLYTSPVQLPIIRLIYSGPAMVVIFFVISGYVLSYRQIGMIRSNSFESLSDLVFSSTFRRGIRLFLPSMAGLTLYHMYIWLGWKTDVVNARGAFGLMAEYFKSLWDLFAVYGSRQRTAQLHHLWTIPIEFAGSMLLVVVICGTSRLSTRGRLTVEAGLMTLFLFTGMWPSCVFIGGMAIAELDAIRSDRKGDLENHNRSRLISSLGSQLLWIAGLLVSLIVLSWPDAAVEDDPLLWWLPSITPGNYSQGLGKERNARSFWHSITATFAIAALSRLQWLQRPFTSRLSLYLGDISYALYIVHYPLTLTLGHKAHDWANAIFGHERPSHLHQFVAISFELAILYFVTFWNADVFWRYVDQPCVCLGKWTEAKLRKS